MDHTPRKQQMQPRPCSLREAELLLDRSKHAASPEVRASDPRLGGVAKLDGTPVVGSWAKGTDASFHVQGAVHGAQAAAAAAAA
eukprot:CAMPEP_0204084432 /NCGR_PEP_ID=MMETSP0360-20130528/180087_1 /ASSEMBLY_ACC=CAM_ASM_000342 /TAXON_ID=268821 /ORGANISM="Scrippsiella Hangoei, Strain SHTV-5" /LENGTH=83 /DNA_ID=CAMNT_0051033427 /DNA_START=238 /DNA_END=488 /DNA_ORIENTATION=-